MGPKHPISLKLKKHKIWNITLYKFNKSNTAIWGEHKNIVKLINHYFQYVLISTPKISYHGDDLLKIKIYYFIKPSNHSVNLLSKTNSFNLIKFENLLKKIYGSSVEFELIRLKNPIYNANILAQFIGINLKKYSVGKIWKILLRKFKLRKNVYIYKTSNKHIFDMSTRVAAILKKPSYKNLNWMHILYKGLFCKEFYSCIAGLKLKISGRISKKRGASRAKVLNYSIGTLNFNSINSSIDYGHIERKDKNGAQSIKVYANYTIGYLP